MTFEFPKKKRIIQAFIGDRCKSKHLSWHGATLMEKAWVTCIV